MVLSDARKPLITSLGQGGMTERGVCALFAPLSPLSPLDAPTLVLDGAALTVSAPDDAEEIVLLADGVQIGVYPLTAAKSKSKRRAKK